MQKKQKQFLVQLKKRAQHLLEQARKRAAKKIKTKVQAKVSSVKQDRSRRTT
jgi:hypothetical protein